MCHLPDRAQPIRPWMPARQILNGGLPVVVVPQPVVDAVLAGDAASQKAWAGEHTGDAQKKLSKARRQAVNISV